jgi:hypothetical protein
MTNNMTTNTKLGQKQPHPQLSEHVIEEVGGVHHQNIKEQVPEVTPGFPLRCSSTNSAAFVVFDHSHRPHKKSTINYQKAKEWW